MEDHAGWKTQEYPVQLAPTGLVAVGISVVWETEGTRHVDNVRLTEADTGLALYHRAWK